MNLALNPPFLVGNANICYVENSVTSSLILSLFWVPIWATAGFFLWVEGQKDGERRMLKLPKYGPKETEY